MSLVTTATACKRGGTLSRRSLYRWHSDYAKGGEAALLPAFRKADPVPVWFDELLEYFQRPQHPTAALAYAEFSAAMRKRGETPPSNPAQQTAADMEFLVNYRTGEEYADMRDLLEVEGIA